jgi:Skp family chaperone for outer membrane proteins
MAPRLKVFVTSDGLTDYVVAASSKPKALAAWGSHQDLFKTGLAHQTDDPALVKAATAQPGEVLRRPAGARGDLAKLKPAKKAKPAGPTKAALKKVADLEKKLADVDAEREAALARIEAQRAALDREAEAVTSRSAARRAKLERALAAARRAPG